MRESIRAPDLSESIIKWSEKDTVSNRGSFEPDSILFIFFTTSRLADRMSVGVGMGDFIKILELVTQAWKRFVNAPSQYDDIANE